MVEKAVEEAGPARALTYVVWLPVLRGDSVEAAREAARTYAAPNVVHYWDSSRALGVELGGALGIPPSRYERGRARGLAWDVYLVYAPAARWADLGQPAVWMHQLSQLDSSVAPRLDPDGFRRRLLAAAGAPPSP